MSAPRFTRSKDGRERATVHIAVRVDKALVQWIAKTFNVSEGTALQRVRERLESAVSDWDSWHTPFVTESGEMDWAHGDDLHELEAGTFYSEGAPAKVKP